MSDKDRVYYSALAWAFFAAAAMAFSVVVGPLAYAFVVLSGLLCIVLAIKYAALEIKDK